MEYLTKRFLEAGVRDPANPGNIISDLLNDKEKKNISDAARIARLQADWKNII